MRDFLGRLGRAGAVMAAVGLLVTIATVLVADSIELLERYEGWFPGWYEETFQKNERETPVVAGGVGVVASLAYALRPEAVGRWLKGLLSSLGGAVMRWLLRPFGRLLMRIPGLKKVGPAILALAFVALLIVCWWWSDWAWAWWAVVGGVLAIVGLVLQVTWYGTEARAWRQTNHPAG